MSGGFPLRYNGDMKIYSWNVNGIRAVIRKELWTPFVGAEQPDIICLQETKAQPDEIDFGMPNYHVLINSAVEKGLLRYGHPQQVATIGALQWAARSPQSGIRHGRRRLRRPQHRGPSPYGRIRRLLLITVYTPNAKDDLSRVPLRHEHWDPAFLAYCKGLETGTYAIEGGSGLPKPVVFCGDLNVAHMPDDLARPSRTSARKASPTKSAQASRRSLTPVSSIPSVCSPKATAISLVNNNTFLSSTRPSVSVVSTVRICPRAVASRALARLCRPYLATSWRARPRSDYRRSLGTLKQLAPPTAGQPGHSSHGHGLPLANTSTGSVLFFGFRFSG